MYPVVADPRVTFGWGVYIHYRSAEARAATRGWRGTIADKAKYTAIICAAIPAVIAAAGCAMYVYDSISSIVATMRNAGATGRGFVIHFWYSGMPLGWGYE